MNTNIVLLIPKISNKYCHSEYVELLLEKEGVGVMYDSNQ